MTLVLTVLTGIVYPLAVTGLCQALFRKQANGSLITANGQVSWLGTDRPEFHPAEVLPAAPLGRRKRRLRWDRQRRIQLGPTSAKLIDRMKASVANFRKENPQFTGELPADAATASASGLDPHISPASAALRQPVSQWRAAFRRIRSASDRQRHRSP